MRAALVGSFLCWVGFVGVAWRFPRPATAALAACALLSAATVAPVGGMAVRTLSVWWLRRFSRGPLELVLHREYLAPRRPGTRGAGRGGR